jgi:hypothetical protein
MRSKWGKTGNWILFVGRKLKQRRNKEIYVQETRKWGVGVCVQDESVVVRLISLLL